MVLSFCGLKTGFTKFDVVSALFKYLINDLDDTVEVRLF